jgi:hypothetical protein
MKGTLISWFALLTLALSSATERAVAQPLPTTPPPVSPYLNLLRRGASPALNYYDIVRPQVEFRNFSQQVQQQVTNNQQSIANLENNPNTLVTGHAAGFMTSSRYFMTRGAQGSSNRGISTGPINRPANSATSRGAPNVPYR